MYLLHVYGYTNNFITKVNGTRCLKGVFKIQTTISNLDKQPTKKEH